MAWRLPTTRIINGPEPVEIEGVKYPANIFTLWSPAELEAIGIEIVPDHAPTRADQEAARAEAYREEADPLMAAWLKHTEIKKNAQKAAEYKAAWEAKVDEIEARYPYPE